MKEEPEARAAPLIAAPATDAAAPPAADAQEAARAQPDGGGASAAEHLQESHAGPPAVKLFETAEADIPAPAQTPPKKPASQPARGHLFALAALAIILLIAGLGILAWERQAIMAAASRFTAFFGLEEPAGAGLDIGAVTSVREEAADGEALVVQGTVSNLTDEARPLPGIRVSLFDTDDKELQHVMVVPDQERLAAGESIAFSARLEQPAPTARRIKVTFAAPGAPD